ncbi:MAG: biopolymer transporter ExbD [Alphaproteobacteria bacterium]|nr:biopolymer transporter ExbD [Alphaproteobacteria bacterium]
MVVHGKNIRKNSRRNANINMTNLMDVMMVLLVVFMVAAPLMTSGIPLELPKVGGGTLDGKETSINISVDKDGAYYIGQSVIEPDTIIDKIMAIKGENQEVTITISGDASSAYGSVIGLMAMLKEAGFSKVGLKTEARRQQK